MSAALHMSCGPGAPGAEAAVWGGGSGPLLDNKQTHATECFATVKLWMKKLLAWLCLGQVCTVTTNNKHY